MDAGGWTVSIFVSLLLVVLVVLAIVWLVRTQNAGASNRHRLDEGGSARELLDRRLVSGEIDEDEYQRLGKAISEAPRPSKLPDHRDSRKLAGRTSARILRSNQIDG